MIKTVARYFKWSPKEIDQLYLDEHDFLGLVFWYNDAVEQDKKIKEISKK